MENFEQNTNQSPNVGTQPVMPSPEVSKKSSGGITVVISIAIIILLLISGLLVWKSQFGNQDVAGNMEAAKTPQPAATVSQNDDLNSIESEANATAIDDSASLDYSFDQQ